MTELRPYLVNGDWRTGQGSFEVKNPYDDQVVAEIAVPTEADVEEAIAAAAAAFHETSRLSVAARSTTSRTASPRRWRRTLG